MRKDMKWWEKSKRSEATLRVRMKHEDDHGMNGDSNLSHSVRASEQERQSRDDDTNWQQKKRDYEKRWIFNAWCLMHWHQLRSQIPKCFMSLHTLLGFSLCTSCQQANCCSCTNLFNFWPVREFLEKFHTEKTVLWGVVFTGSEYKYCASSIPLW